MKVDMKRKSHFGVGRGIDSVDVHILDEGCRLASDDGMITA